MRMKGLKKPLGFAKAPSFGYLPHPEYPILKACRFATSAGGFTHWKLKQPTPTHSSSPDNRQRLAADLSRHRLA